MKLLWSRRLGPLCLSQACGAFNDNLVKNAMVVLAIFRLGAGGAGLAALAGALFIAPYALLSATAGQLADRFDKSRLIRVVKAAEVALMAERSDISEECVRLRSHCRQFRALLAGGGPVGRRLEFLLQEMHREITTIGAKAGDLEIAGRVVDVKAELEKMREQVQNIE